MKHKLIIVSFCLLLPMYGVWSQGTTQEKQYQQQDSLKYGFTRQTDFVPIVKDDSLQIQVQTRIQANSADPEAEQIKLPVVIPPSPEAAALGRYGQIPVGLFTGTPQIDIPLYTIESKGFNIPISVSYHASGVKVEDVASSVGLGWVLNCGGAINRHVKGHPDEHQNGLLNIPQNASSYEFCYRAMNPHQADSRDRAPDIFSYNFLGYSGKFSFGSDGNIYLMPFNDLQIEFIDQSYFRVTTPEGHVLLFTEKEASTYRSGDTNLFSGVTTCWHLSRITLCNNGGVFDFTYITSGWHTETNYSYTTTIGPYYTMSCKPPEAHSPALCTISANNTMDEIVSTCQLSVAMKYVQKIAFENGRVEFEYSDNRFDYTDAKKLQSVKIYRQTETQPVKQWQFYQSMVENQAGYNPYVSGPEYRRMFLDSICERSQTLQAGQVYRMAYDPTPLPPRKNCGADIWGYYNGKFDNKSLVYLENYLGRVVFNGKTYTIPNLANRSVDIQKMQAGILKKLTYPTGGYTQFEYEAHKYKRPYTTSGGNPVTRTFHARANQDDAPNDPNRIKTFTMSEDALGTVLMTIPVNDQTPSYVKFEDLDDLSVTYTFITWPEEATTRTFTIGLQNGHTYRISAYIDILGYDDDKYASIQVSWEEDQSQGTTEMIVREGGGLRIKSMTDHDQNGQAVLSKHYRYGSNEDGIGRFSFFDYLLDYNNVCTKKYRQGFSDPYLPQPFCHIEEYQRMHILDHPVYSMPDLGGSFIAYHKVTEYENSPTGPIGKVEYFYDIQMNEYVPDDDAFHYPDQDRLMTDSWKSGQLLRKRVYKKTANSFELVQKTSNTYQTYPIQYSSGWIIGEKIIYNGECPSAWETRANVRTVDDDFYKFEIPITSAIKVLTATVDTMIFNGSNVIQSTGYGYGGLQRSQGQYSFVTEETQKHSQNYTLRKVNKYPIDFSTSAPYSDMLSRHMIAPMLEQTLYKDNTFLSMNRTHYSKDWFADKHIIAPSTIETRTKDQSSPETRIRYHSYDTYGNPTCVSYENGPMVIYIWGYKDQYPVAKIESSSKESSFYNTVINAIGASNMAILSGNPTDAQVKSIFTSLRGNSNIAGSLVTTYTYQPLVGMTSETDPSGRTIFYEYDAFGRLKCIKDENGKILKENRYHYAGQ